MKKILNKRWFQAGLVSSILGASTGFGYGQTLLYSFNSSADTTPWVNANQSATVTSSFIAGDAPPGQALSTGALGFTGTFGPGGTSAFGGLSLNIPVTDLSGYSDLQFDVQVLNNSYDQFGQIQSIQVNLQGNPSTYDTSTFQPEIQGPITANNGWVHFDIPMSDFSGQSLTQIYQIHMYVYDGDYTAATSMQLAFDNIEFTTAVVPEPSPLALFGFGVVALGLTTCYRRKLVS